MFAVFVLLALLVFLVLSFMFIKTGLLFIGGVIVLLSSIVIITIFIHLFYCFINNRKYSYKFVERVLLSSIITLGLGIGISLYSLAHFDYKVDKVEEEIIVPMNDNIKGTWYHIYQVENRNDLRIVSTHSKYYKLFYDENTNDLYNDYIYEDRYKEFKNIITDLNNKKIIDYRTDYITIYTSQENIDKLRQMNGY